MRLRNGPRQAGLPRDSLRVALPSNANPPGCAAYAFDAEGRAAIDEVGELAITQPMPSMPLTGKKLEVPIRRILMGLPAKKAANRAALVDPAALDFFIDYAANQTDYPRAG